MFWNLFNRNKIETSTLFTGHFVEVKAFYVVEFNKVPCVTFIGELDVSKAFAAIEEKYKMQVKKIYQHNYFNHDEQKMFFNNTVFVLSDHRMIELSNNYCQVLHSNLQYVWANTLINELAQFRQVAEAAKETRIIGFSRQNDMN